jgi:hypothetical protein
METSTSAGRPRVSRRLVVSGSRIDGTSTSEAGDDARHVEDGADAKPAFGPTSDAWAEGGGKQNQTEGPRRR